MDNLKEFNSANAAHRRNRILVIVLIIAILSLATTSVFFYMNFEKTIAELQEVNHEKETLTFQYQNLLDEYDSLETSHDTLSTQLSAEKERIVELMTKLRSTKAQNKTQITKYKKELKTLRNIMKGFIHQIDSLNTMNIELVAENKEIKQQFYSAKRENQKLNEKYEDATSKVALASVIKAINLSIESYNHKGKLTTRAKKTKRFGIKFTLDENVIAPTGIKKLFIRISDPNNHVLIHDEQPMFNFEGEEIAYSEYREVEYSGVAETTIVYFENKGDELPTGKYKFDIFCDGNMIGSSITTLK